MLRIIGWVGGTCFAAVMLSQAASANLIGVAFGLLLWGGAAYAISASLLRIQEWRAAQPAQGVRAFGREDIVAIARATPVWLLFFLAARAVDSARRLRLIEREEGERQEDERRDRRLAIAGFLSLALWFWILGIWVILQSEPFGFVVGIMAGPALLVAAWWLFRRLRRNYARFFTARQFDQVFLHLVGSLVLAVCGVTVLVAVV